MVSQKFILVTRPEPDASAFAAKIKAAGLNPLVSPVLKIEPLPFAVPDLTKCRGFVFTSTNAVRLMPKGLALSMPVYCVGDRTAAEARLHGFKDITSASGNAADLAALLVMLSRQDGKRLLHIHGRHVASNELKKVDGIDGVEIYHTARMENLSPACIRALKEGQVEAVTVFSARTARTFVNLVRKAELSHALRSIKLLSISEAVLQSVRTYAWTETYVAEKPEAASMLGLITSVCRQ